jgi:hypothetical protein
MLEFLHMLIIHTAVCIIFRTARIDPTSELECESEETLCSPEVCHMPSALRIGRTIGRRSEESRDLGCMVVHTAEHEQAII